MNDKIPAILQAAMNRKHRYVSPEGVTFYLNSADRTKAIAAKHGGQALPPKSRAALSAAKERVMDVSIQHFQGTSYLWESQDLRMMVDDFGDLQAVPYCFGPWMYESFGDA